MIIHEDNVFTTSTCGGLTYDDCILGQAGTYIKEFVHGDLGRTHPRYEAPTNFSLPTNLC